MSHTPVRENRASARAEILICSLFALLLIVLLASGKSIGQVYTGDRIIDLFAGRGEFDRLSFRPPLYPLLLAFLETTMGQMIPLVKVAAFLNIGFFTGSIWLGFRILFFLGLGASRLLICPLLAFFPYFILEVFVVRETLFYSFLVMAFIYTVLHWKSGVFFSIVLGLIAGSAELVRPSGIVFLITGILMFLLSNPKSGKARYYQSIGFIGVYILLVAPWSAMLSYHSGQAVFSSSCTTGLNFFKGSSKEAGNFYLYADVDNLKVPLDSNLSRCAADAALATQVKGQVIERATSQPLLLFRDSLVKFNMFSAGIAPIARAEVEVHDDYTYSLSGTTIHMNSLVLLPIGIAVYTMAALGCWLAINRGSPEARRTMYAVVLLVLGHQAIHVITWPETRYTFPFILPLLMSAMYLVDRLRSICCDP